MKDCTRKLEAVVVDEDPGGIRSAKAIKYNWYKETFHARSMPLEFRPNVRDAMFYVRPLTAS